jgi:hypothetical protein
MKLFYVSVFLLFAIISSQAQIIKSKLDIVGGLSAREYFHIGARYQYAEIAQLGVYVGNDLELNSSEAISTFCIDNMIHFGKLSYYSNRPVWYARQGYTYLKNRLGEQETRKYSYIDISAGREFPLNDRFGLSADLGLMVQFREYREINPPINTPLNTYWHTMPLARIQFYFSF